MSNNIQMLAHFYSYLTEFTETMNMSFKETHQFRVVKFYSTPESNLTTEQTKYVIDAFSETLFFKFGQSNAFSALPDYTVVGVEPNLLCALRILFV